MGQPWIGRAVRNPEANFLLISFLFNFVWEMWQMPFYEGLKTLDYMSVVRTCTQASLGDGVISVLAYWSAVVIAPCDGRYSGGNLFGCRAGHHDFYGVASNRRIGPLAVRAKHAGDALLGTGLLPILQWLILPPLILWIVRQQTVGGSEKRVLPS